MAFSVTARHSGNGGQTAAQTLTTDSATETADSLLLVGSAAQNDQHSAAQDGQSLSGGGLTYTQVVQTDVVAWDGSANFRMRGALHSAPISGSPSAHTIAIDHYIEGAGGDEGFYCAVAVDITGHDAADPVAQSATNASSLGGGDSESGSVTLAATPTVGNLVVVLLTAGADGGGGFAAPTFGGQSMTQAWNQNDSWTQAGMWYRVVDGTESTDVITCTDLGDSVGQFTAVAVEIAAGDDGGTTAPYGRVTETETARALVASKAAAFGRAVETVVVRAFGLIRAYATGRAVETETARGFTASKSTTAGRVTETETARALTAAKTAAYGRATESETARLFAVAKTADFSRVAEVETARAFTAAFGQVYGRVTETEQARGFTASKSVAFGRVVETETARAFSTDDVAESVVTAQGVHSLIATATGTHALTVTAGGTHDLIVEAEGAL